MSTFFRCLSMIDRWDRSTMQRKTRCGRCLKIVAVVSAEWLMQTGNSAVWGQMALGACIRHFVTCPLRMAR